MTNKYFNSYFPHLFGLAGGWSPLQKVSMQISGDWRSEKPDRCPSHDPAASMHCVRANE